MSTQVIQAGKESKVAGFSLSSVILEAPGRKISVVRIVEECYLPIAQNQTKTKGAASTNYDPIAIAIDAGGAVLAAR
jgi:hypothetical protein